MVQNKKIKVLQINTFCGSGSTGRIAVNINNNLIKNGHEGVVAYGVGISDYPHSYKIGGKINYYYHNIMSRVFGHEGFYSVVVTKKFIKWIEEYKPDIIHLHNIHGHYINAKLLFNYLKSKKLPVVWTLHDCWPFTGKCAHFDMVACDKWKTACCSCPQLSEYPSSILDSSIKDYNAKKELFMGVDMHFVTPSSWLKELLHQSFLKENCVEVIKNGINLNVFKKRELKEGKLSHQLEGKFVVLGVAMPWSKRKGFDDFIKISQKLKSNEKAVVVMVGLSAEQIEQVPKNVIAIKRTENAQTLAQLYSRADVFVNTTYEDNFPTVNLESIACGTNVITYDAGGSPEAVTEHNAGWVVEKGNSLKIVEMIKNFVVHGVPPVQLDLKLLSSIISDDRYLEKYAKLIEGENKKPFDKNGDS